MKYNEYRESTGSRNIRDQQEQNIGWAGFSSGASSLAEIEAHVNIIRDKDRRYPQISILESNQAYYFNSGTRFKISVCSSEDIRELGKFLMDCADDIDEMGLGEEVGRTNWTLGLNQAYRSNPNNKNDEWKNVPITESDGKPVEDCTIYGDEMLMGLLKQSKEDLLLEKSKSISFPGAIEEIEKYIDHYSNECKNRGLEIA